MCSLRSCAIHDLEKTRLTSTIHTWRCSDSGFQSGRLWCIHRLIAHEWTFQPIFSERIEIFNKIWLFSWAPLTMRQLSLPGWWAGRAASCISRWDSIVFVIDKMYDGRRYLFNRWLNIWCTSRISYWSCIQCVIRIFMLLLLNWRAGHRWCKPKK